MGQRHFPYAAALALLWSPGLLASDHVTPMQLAPPASLEAAQQKAAPSPKPLQRTDPKTLQQPRSAIEGERPRLAPKVGSPAMDPGNLPVAPTARPPGPPAIEHGGRSATLEGGPSGPPDLTVSRLEIVSEEIRFRVLNRGPGEKKPGRIEYYLEVVYYGSGGNSSPVQTYGGLMPLTSLARLGPGQETGEDRIVRRLTIGQRMGLKLCVNPEQAVVEENYDNNCLERIVEQRPDLEIVEAYMEGFRKRPTEETAPWWRRAAGAARDFADFDTSGKRIHIDVVLRVRNNGRVPASGFDVFVALWKEDGSGGEQRETTYPDVLEPRETGEIKIRVISKDLLRNATCCGGTAIVDHTKRVPEANEGNNKTSIAYDD